ncbi:MAG: 30S ribosomal protein S13 [Candidatus Rokuibacteriota bacterium]|nr:MAG: 30S ribosomal protein S13 [Candidatus Rokubacteria bacterium]
MARVAGVDLPREKRGEVAVTYIYGLGRSTARSILLRATVDPSKRVKAWTEEEVARIREIIEREFKVEGDLRRDVSMNVKRLMDIGTYRGIRHRRGLPKRGVQVKKKTAAAPSAPAPAAAAAPKKAGA